MVDAEHKAPCPSCGQPIPSFSVACMHCGAATAAGVPPSRDADHLRLLALFHFIYSILHAVLFSFPVIHVIMGILIVTSGMPTGRTGAGPVDAFVGWMFIVAGSLFLLIGWGSALLIAQTGKWIRQRRRHLACLIVAGLLCTCMPFGTALGVFTFIVLLRPSVKATFR